MAVLQMQRISICGLKKDRKKVLELLQRQSVVEVQDLISEDNVFKKSDTLETKLTLEKNVNAIVEALTILNRYSPAKGSILDMLNGRTLITTQEYEEFSNKYNATLESVNRILLLNKSVAENKAEILKLESIILSLKPWKNLDISLDFNGTRDTKAFVGVLPSEWSLERLYEHFALLGPLEIEVVSSSKEQTNIFVLAAKSSGEKLYEELRSIGFAFPNAVSSLIPRKHIEEIEASIEQLSTQIMSFEKEIAELASVRNDILFLHDYESMAIEKTNAQSQMVESKKVFFVSGYIPEKESDKIVSLLNESFSLAIDLEMPGDEEDVPVVLENNAFATPLESTVAAYSLPGKGDVDPTMMMSLFYYVLFGLMLSDAGYGAIIALGCGFALYKFKDKLEPSMAKTLKMYLYCGISTVFWGILFGSYFGDLLDVTTAKFFGEKIMIPPAWFFPVEEPMKMLTFAMALGVIHLLTGLSIKGYSAIKSKDMKTLFYDVVSWFVLIISCIMVLLCMDMFLNIIGATFKLPYSVFVIFGIIAIICCIVILATNGRESKNPGKRFLKGLYALYGLSGYLSDVLSYSRLLALGLATGVICSVINKMAAMVPGGVVGAILFTIIVIAGHALNLGINALGAYVHTNRLQYVEFFGKFYEGGGRSFKPLSINTKYFKFKESK